MIANRCLLPAPQSLFHGNKIPGCSVHPSRYTFGGRLAMAVCTNCGNSLNGEARFCSNCGTPVGAPQAAQNTQNYGQRYSANYGATRLIRPRAGRMIAGVCQGLANSYSWDVTWVRVIAV